LQGVTVWLVFFLGALWLGVARGFMEEVTDRRYRAFPVHYLVGLVYDALASLPDLAAKETAFPETPSVALRDAVAQRFTDIMHTLNCNALVDYAMQNGGLHTLLGHGVSTPPLTPSKSVAAAPTPSRGAVQGSGVCFGSLGTHYQVANLTCKEPAACTRLHYEQLPPGTTRAGLTAMISGLKQGDFRDGLLAAIAQDPLLPA
jgi:hypothetical protein